MHVLQNKVAYVRVKMKDLRTGARIETALKGSDQKFKLCLIDRRNMQYILILVIHIHLWIMKHMNKLKFLPHILSGKKFLAGRNELRCNAL